MSVIDSTALDISGFRHEQRAAPSPSGWRITLPGQEPYLAADELVRDTIPRTGVGFLAGQSGAGKTFAAIELSACIATGEPFAGRKVEKLGGTIYAAFEASGTIKGRMKARRTRMEADTEWPFVLLAGGGLIATDAERADFERAVGAAVAKMTDHWRVEPRILFADTISASGIIPPDGENDPGHWTRAFAFFNEIAARYRLVVVAIHHYGKSAEAGLRGSSNARAGGDFTLALSCERDEITGDSRNHRLALTKSRDAPEGSIAAVRAEKVEIGKRADGEPITSLVLEFDCGSRIVTVQKGRNPGRGERAFEESFREVIATHGEVVRVRGEADAPSVRAVGIEHVKAEFTKRYVTAAPEEDKRADAIRKQFGRALTKAIESGRFASGTWGGIERIWSIAEARPA